MRKSELTREKQRLLWEEMYQYIKNNQTDVDNVKTTVSSLKKLFKTYKKEILR